MAEIHGFRELSNQLKAMGDAAGGKALRAAAMSAMLPAVKEARAAAPVGNPPFEDGKDPYPVRTYTGGLRTPGFAKRNIARKSFISKDRRQVKVMLGVRPKAFYAVQFLELGTSRIPKRPWLEPAFRRSLPQVNARFKQNLKKLIDKAAKVK